MLHNLTLESFRRSIISAGYVVTPFGLRRFTYADHTASGRPSEIVEKYIRDQVMPWYANTHSEDSYAGRHSTDMRETARNVLKKSFGATSDYAVILTGQGTTSAIGKLIDVLGIRIPSNLNARYRLSDHIPDKEKPVILVGPWEHHSNELPWRESIGKVVEVELGDDGGFDLSKLDETLAAHRGKPLIASFSAASNVTGEKAPIGEIAKRVKAAGGLIFFDCAALATHASINIADLGADGIFFSGHKFMGGPGSPGVLIAHKRLFVNAVPSLPGGGTVSCVTSDAHWYLSDFERREEAGSPDVLGAVRLGLAIIMRDTIGTARIEQIEKRFREKAVKEWSKDPEIRILGNTSKDAVSIISFEIYSPKEIGGKKLHHNFVVRLLNDLFGIQCRGGCMCAGPYTVRLMGSCPLEGCTGGSSPEILRPGFTRLSFNFLTTEEECEYIIRAVSFLAKEGYKFLPNYMYSKDHGSWKYRGADRSSPRIPSMIETFNIARKLSAERIPGELQGEEGMNCWFAVPSDVRS